MEIISSYIFEIYMEKQRKHQFLDFAVPSSFAAKQTVPVCVCLSGAAAENMLGSLLCPHGSSSVLLDPYGSTISETTSEAWSVEVLPSDSGTNIPLWMRFIRVYASLAQQLLWDVVGGWDAASACSALQAWERKGAKKK